MAGGKARDERARAEKVAEAVGPAVSRVGEAEANAIQGYRKSVESQLAADATGIPRLSGSAQVALGVVAAVKDDAGRVEAWETVQNDEPVVSEISAFSAAVEKRFGQDGVRAMIRAEQSGAGISEGGASVSTEHRAAAAEVARTVVTIKVGEGAAESPSEAELLEQRETQFARLRY